MKVKELFTDESRWIQHYVAKDVYGRPCSVTGNAASFCLLGAVSRCYVNDDWRRVMDKIKLHIMVESITVWNDSPERTFEEVKKLVNELDI